MKPLAALVLLVLLATGCTSPTSFVISGFDDTTLLWRSGQDQSELATPIQFAVTPQEVISLIPKDSKIGWSLYADLSHYYLRENADALIWPTPTNSVLARRYGYAVPGLDRSSFEAASAEARQSQFGPSEQVLKKFFLIDRE